MFLIIIELFFDKGVFSNYSNSCQSIWDGWSCHQTTPAGNISQVKCPDHFIADTCNSILGLNVLLIEIKLFVT